MIVTARLIEIFQNVIVRMLNVHVLCFRHWGYWLLERFGVTVTALLVEIFHDVIVAMLSVHVLCFSQWSLSADIGAGGSCAADPQRTETCRATPCSAR